MQAAAFYERCADVSLLVSATQSELIWGGAQPEAVAGHPTACRWRANERRQCRALLRSPRRPEAVHSPREPAGGRCAVQRVPPPRTAAKAGASGVIAHARRAPEMASVRRTSHRLGVISPARMIGLWWLGLGEVPMRPGCSNSSWPTTSRIVSLVLCNTGRLRRSARKRMCCHCLRYATIAGWGRRPRVCRRGAASTTRWWSSWWRRAAPGYSIIARKPSTSRHKTGCLSPTRPRGTAIRRVHEGAPAARIAVLLIEWRPSRPR
jgi:hypothetical protein